MVAVVAVLVVGGAVGLWRRRTDGQLRDVAPGAAGRRLSNATPAGQGGRLSDATPVDQGRRSSDATPVDNGGRLGDAPPIDGGGRPSGVAPGDAGVRPGLVAPADAGAGSRSSNDITPVGEVGERLVVPDEREEPGVIEGSGADRSAAGERLDPALLRELGVGPAPATLLQFSSAFCAPCRAVRRVSAEVAGMVPGVQHVEVDAESHLEAVRALGIWRTPTLLVLDADGRVAKRATGVPGKPQLIAALGAVL